MSDDKLRVPLTARQDKDGRVYYIGKLRAPVSIDCKEGTAFIIFTSEQGEEEMQIVSSDDKYKKKMHHQ